MSIEAYIGRHCEDCGEESLQPKYRAKFKI